MSVKGWAEAQRHKGGIIKYLYDKIVALDAASGGDETDITALKTTVGNSSSGLVKKVADVENAIGDEDTEGTILARIKALEDAT